MGRTVAASVRNRPTARAGRTGRPGSVARTASGTRPGARRGRREAPPAGRRGRERAQGLVVVLAARTDDLRPRPGRRSAVALSTDPGLSAALARDARHPIGELGLPDRARPRGEDPPRPSVASWNQPWLGELPVTADEGPCLSPIARLRDEPSVADVRPMSPPHGPDGPAGRCGMNGRASGLGAPWDMNPTGGAG
jgi:hypothetical protein